MDGTNPFEMPAEQQGSCQPSRWKGSCGTACPPTFQRRHGARQQRHVGRHAEGDLQSGRLQGKPAAQGKGRLFGTWARSAVLWRRPPHAALHSAQRMPRQAGRCTCAPALDMQPVLRTQFSKIKAKKSHQQVGGQGLEIECLGAAAAQVGPQHAVHNWDDEACKGEVKQQKGRAVRARSGLGAGCCRGPAARQGCGRTAIRTAAASPACRALKTHPGRSREAGSPGQ